jgi:uncharacterized membrane protein YfcA
MRQLRHTVTALLAIAVNLAAMAILLAMAVAVDHVIWRILLVIAACGAALGAATRAYSLRQSRTTHAPEDV